MPQEEPWTVRRLLEWTTEYFAKQGSETPRLDAEILLASALGIKRIALYTDYDHIPGDAQRTVFRDWVKRRGAGEPVAYLVGYKEFFSLPFRVDRETLIPRPETEQLVLETLDLLKNRSFRDGPHIADIGTGSGCVAVAVAKNLPRTLAGCRITAVDLSPGALEIARQNARDNGVAERIEFVESDLFAAFPQPGTSPPFDIVLSNPPYVTEAEYEELAVGVKRYEPRSALVAGPRGTEIVQRLVAQSVDRLRPGGTLLVEVSPMIASDCLALFDAGTWTGTRILRDDAGRDRIVAAERAHEPRG